MKVKQKSIRAFEFTVTSPDDETELRAYIDQNIEILASFLISIEGSLSKESVDFLETRGLKYVTAPGTLHAKARTQSMPAPVREEAPAEAPESGGILQYFQPIRSGNELECDDDIVIFGRINSGAKVIAKKNAIIFSRIEGVVEALGDYLVVKEVGKGQLFFHGESVPAEAIKGKLTKVTVKGGVIGYEEL